MVERQVRYRKAAGFLFNSELTIVELLFLGKTLKSYGAMGPTSPPVVVAWPDKRRAYTAQNRPISGRVDRASATETVDSGSIPGRVKPKTIKIGIHSFPA